MSTTADSMASANVDEQAAQPPGPDAEQGARTLRAAAAPYAGAEAAGGRRILVPLDGSRRAAAALPHAVALASATAAPISLLAVVASLPLHAGLPSAAGQEADERRVVVSTAYLEAVATPLRTRGLAVATTVRHGDPASEILAESEEEGCWLIVMGTHGRTGLARLRAGSVAQRVLRHATIPTLVVPPGGDEPAGGAAAIAAITVTLDGSALAEGALPLAAHLAAALAVPLALLRVIPSRADPANTFWVDGYYAYYPASQEEELAREEERAVEAYLDAIAARLRAPGLEVRTAWERGVTGAAAGPIAEYLARRPTGLAVMASHGRGGVLRWALGSTAEAVLDQAPCPLLIVRAGATASAGRAGVTARVAQHGG